MLNPFKKNKKSTDIVFGEFNILERTYLNILGFNIDSYSIKKDVATKKDGSLKISNTIKLTTLSILSENINTLYQIGTIVNNFLIILSKQILLVFQEVKYAKEVGKENNKHIKNISYGILFDSFSQLYQLIDNGLKEKSATIQTLKFINHFGRIIIKIEKSQDATNLLKLHKKLNEESKKISLYLINEIKNVKMIDKKISISSNIILECGKCSEYHINTTICPYCILSH